ncbi:hypothetical protein Q5W88_16325 [Shouchella clausii]|uniref:hypothetical protein n=1 Tax=Shouchella clausii TaxID=79880 RepID=UPI0026F47C87|nr:hypothetical protein [Shouchella clausii]MDO7284688.1 hypothetical protein [Shouchella clausii]MDO7304783.1 hypothetical protein [Shouchella clausii]
MKKLGIALGVSICVLVYFFVENSHLKNEIVHLKEENQKQLDTKENFNADTAESAEAFIKAYFTYNGKPKREEVEPYATSNALSKLQFGDAEGLGEESEEEIESIISDVKNVNVYLGKSSDDRQKVAVIFDNEITFNKIKSTASTIMELDMIVNEDIWKVDNFTFNQF